MRVDVLSVVLLSVLFAADSRQNDPRAHAIALATAELARSLGVSEESIVLVDARAAEWRDSSLGCPERGMVYSPIITSGYLVTLRSGGTRYALHVGEGRAVVCGGEASEDPRPGKLTQSDAAIGLKRAEEARADLARNLGVARDRVTIDLFQPTVWPDSRLGCPGEPPASPRPTRGFRIQLTSGGTTYEYHSDLTNRPRRCGAASGRER